MLSASSSDPAKSLAAVAAALGLDPKAAPEEIMAAFEALVGQLPAPAADPGAEAAAAPPRPRGAQAAPAAQKLGDALKITRGFVTRPKPAPVAQLSGAELTRCKTLGITPTEYATRKRAAVRRAR